MARAAAPDWPLRNFRLGSGVPNFPFDLSLLSYIAPNFLFLLLFLEPEKRYEPPVGFGHFARAGYNTQQ